MKKCGVCGNDFPRLWKAKTRDRPSMCQGCAKSSSVSDDNGSGNTKCRQPKKRSKIAPYSDKKLKELAKYRLLRDAYLSEHNRCQAGFEGICTSGPVELHHRAPRAFHLCDVTIFYSVCRSCHNHIHANTEWSYENGYLLSKHGEKQG